VYFANGQTDRTLVPYGYLMCYRRPAIFGFQLSREAGVGQKVLLRPSADSFSVGRRQKVDIKKKHI
jgi:hypothetical protein